ncbi:glycosyltransferase family 4 protein [Methylicorpusculum sp.]|uniref:glycosyltransferase family 4 protein n=1 Tax=Methylicorpusculum sp. TaxID=2713644 RepID=UPI00273196AD|nr:glycosyltransferase family 4 protein [Methylicorpusculum sp.]MDP2178677.1 glycosyltransferase family 4 protein [Methylicorpusculum sp.]MDP3529562.1 glycosyltransferase family 4 protein [Methylicorpusculum sp.]MDZ4154487.1 glycosyltransferase family 4 protein [Methylicorpusculum sp.]
MKVLQLNHSDTNGGASRAAYRIHHALRIAGVDSTMIVDDTSTGDWTVQGPSTKWERLSKKIRPYFGVVLTRLLKTGNSIFHSPAVLPSGRVAALNSSDADVVHLHWVQDEMLSIADIGFIKKPMVWTLHDMWAFCGAEHYTEDFRWREGYHHGNRPTYETGFDLNRWTWMRKYKRWHRPMHIVTPSSWLADCVRDSSLMRGWPVTVVPNCLDTDRWQPFDQTLAREMLGLPNGIPLLLFGAMGGGRDPRKGFDLMACALKHLRGEIPELELLVFGQLEPHNPPDLGFPVHYTGHLYDDLSLRALYSAADALVVPSRQEAFGQTASEALACGTPVVAFSIGGLPDIVEHHRNGYLAPAFDAEELARGIQWVLKDAKRYETLSENARSYALTRFSYPVVAEQYLKLYQDLTA